VFADIQTTLRDFRIVDVHGNNYGRPFDVAGELVPNVIELTLIREDLLDTVELSGEALLAPELDFPNRLDLPDFELGFLGSR
jgi:hypothetical protein